MSKIRKYSVENLDTSGKMTIFAPALSRNMKTNSTKLEYDAAEVAQLVEQRIRNAWVTGSSPVFGSM